MWIFPLIMILVMLLVVYLIFGRGGFRGPCWHGDERNRSRQDSDAPLEILNGGTPKGRSAKRNSSESGTTF
jgi:hypothetical protein